jgi:hypothetical protein
VRFIAKMDTKMDIINRDTRREKMDLVLTEHHDPFPGLYNGSAMHRDRFILMDGSLGRQGKL